MTTAPASTTELCVRVRCLGEWLAGLADGDPRLQRVRDLSATTDSFASDAGLSSPFCSSWPADAPKLVEAISTLQRHAGLRDRQLLKRRDMLLNQFRQQPRVDEFDFWRRYCGHLDLLYSKLPLPQPAPSLRRPWSPTEAVGRSDDRAGVHAHGPPRL